MGICSSCESAPVAIAKLVMVDGSLREFLYLAKASRVLEKDSTIFICNSDEMDFEEFLSRMNTDEELLRGNLYFALPLNRLSRGLQGKEMTALAAKACSPLKKSGSEKCGCVPKRFAFSVGKRAPRWRRVIHGGASSGRLTECSTSVNTVTKQGSSMPVYIVSNFG